VRLLVEPGIRFNRLTIVKEVEKRGAFRRFSCRCDCGNELVTTLNSLRTGHTGSCGCFMRERLRASRLKHGHTTNHGHTRIYNIWSGMIGRCTNQNEPTWDNYGGRGIKVCERWLEFENFLADMGEPPAGMSIDRYPNNDGNYEPSNCRWATSQDQANNRRSNVSMTAFGMTKTLAAWARSIGITQQTLQSRLRRGGSSEEILKPRAEGRGRPANAKPIVCSALGAIVTS
jgi:hypothetical protein